MPCFIQKYLPPTLVTKNDSEVEILNSQVAPESLNLSEGLAGTLVERIVLHKTKEAEQSGSNAVERMRKRKATAEENLRSHDKRITAGLLAAAGKFRLAEDVRDYVRERVNEREEREYNRQLQKKDTYDALYAKVHAIRELNLPPERWNQAQLKVMIRWFKQDGDEKLLSKKQDQLARYYATCERGELEVPQLPQPVNRRDDDEELDAVHPLQDIDHLPEGMEEEYSSDEQELARLLAGGFRQEEEDIAAAVVAATAV